MTRSLLLSLLLLSVVLLGTVVASSGRIDTQPIRVHSSSAQDVLLADLVDPCTWVDNIGNRYNFSGLAASTDYFVDTMTGLSFTLNICKNVKQCDQPAAVCTTNTHGARWAAGVSPGEFSQGTLDYGQGALLTYTGGEFGCKSQITLRCNPSAKNPKVVFQSEMPALVYNFPDSIKGPFSAVYQSATVPASMSIYWDPSTNNALVRYETDKQNVTVASLYGDTQRPRALHWMQQGPSDQSCCVQNATGNVPHTFWTGMGRATAQTCLGRPTILQSGTVSGVLSTPLLNVYVGLNDQGVPVCIAAAPPAVRHRSRYLPRHCAPQRRRTDPRAQKPLLLELVKFVPGPPPAAAFDVSACDPITCGFGQ